MEVRALRVGNRKQRDLCHVVRNTEDLLNPSSVLQRGGDPGCAKTAGAQCQAEAPGGLNNGVEQARASAAVVPADDSRDDDGGDLGKMLGQVSGRRDHSFVAVACAS